MICSRLTEDGAGGADFRKRRLILSFGVGHSRFPALPACCFRVSLLLYDLAGFCLVGRSGVGWRWLCRGALVVLRAHCWCRGDVLDS